MTPVKQDKLHDAEKGIRGNCYAACLASLLDIPLWMVPPFEDMEEWYSRTQKWLRICFGKQISEVRLHRHDLLPEFYMANGVSPRGIKHSVIYSKGALVHDPHPSNDGLTSVEWCWYLEPAEAE